MQSVFPVLAHLAKHLNIPRRARLSLLSLMDVSGRVRRRLIVPTEAKQGNVVTDDILMRVETKLEDTTG
jgi:hypothetical protein